MSGQRLLIFGATGDLTGRYLLPALAEAKEAGVLADGTEIVGVAREPWDDAAFRDHAAARLDRHADDVDAKARVALASDLRYHAGDVADPEVIAAAAAGADDVIAYLALPPAVFAPAVEALIGSGVADRCRVVIEKPFGTDLKSAQELNALLAQGFAERAVFRVDHFLGKQTVQNILGIRFANRLFEPLFCAEHVERVDIVWDETIALEGRAGYFDHTGALRDMVQNHLLQLLALVAMERPDGLGEGPLRDAKVAALRAVRGLTPEEVATHTSRARYVGYVDEPGVDPSRMTETFVDVTLFVDNDRWTGVPFRLRTGKALGARRREVRVTFRPVERLPFGQDDDPGPNVLIMAMDPDRLTIDIALNGAGDPFCLEPARWELELARQELSAYARLLVDVFEGDPALAVRGDEAEESWRIVEPILAAWSDGTAVPLTEYAAG